MTDTPIEQQPGAAPVSPSETPPAPAPADSDLDLDSLLAQYDREVPATDEPVANAGRDSPEQTVEQQIADILGPDPKIAELQGQVDALTAEAREAHCQQEVLAFEAYAKSIQSRLPSHLEPDWARTQLLAKAAENPELEFAWQNRAANRAQIDLEITKVEMALQHLRRDPNADPQKIAELQTYGYRLGIAYNAQAIIKKAERDLIKRAEADVPIDRDASELKADISFLMKSGASNKRIVEPSPAFGKMSDQEFRQWKLDNLGWA